MEPKQRRHALVIGGSIAGLLAARVLSEHFEAVSIIDKDQLPEQPTPRRYVPQAQHFHSLLASGREAMSALFPDFASSLLANGARSGDTGRGVRWVVFGQRHCARDSGISGIAASRGLIEHTLRQRVRAIARVHWHQGSEVLSLCARADGARVTGVRLQSHAGESTIPADLVIDCSGRGSRMPAWLQALGFAAPPVQEQRIDARYRSRQFRLPPSAMGELRTLVVATRPGQPRYGVIGYQDNGLHLCSLGGLGGEQAPADLEGYLAFARSLAAPDLHEILRQGEPVDEPRAFGVPSNLRRRYERLRRLPSNLLAMGDAVCSFNPTYGQGMSVAALQAIELGRWLQQPAATPSNWFKAIARIIDAPWSIVTGGDALALGLPESRQAIRGLINTYLGRLHAAATVDPQVANAFLHVANLNAPPSSLLAPSTMWKVWRTNVATSTETAMSRMASPPAV